MPYKAKIVTRSSTVSTVTQDNLNKGEPLTFEDIDGSLLNLRDQSIGIASDDSTVITVGMGNTIKIAGAGTVTTAVSGDTLTITGTGGGGSAQGITVVGDDSTGTLIADGETVKIAGAQNITTAVSGDTLTITGPNLSSYATQSYVDNKVSANNTLTIADDTSTTSSIDLDNTLQVIGGNNITTSISGSTLTISGDKSIDVNEINSGDSSSIQINDAVNISGTLNAKTIVTNDLISEDSSAINVLDGLNVSGTLSADVLDVNELSSNDSTAIQINDAVNISGAATINNTLAVTSTSRFTGDATFIGSITGDTNSPVIIAPDGTGDVHLNTDSVRIGDNNSDATIATRGTGDLIITTNEGSGTEGTIRLYDGANGNITVTPNGTGSIVLDGLNWPQTDGTANYVLKTNGSGQLSWVAQTTDTNTTYSISAETATGGANLRLTDSAAGTDDVKLAEGTGITVTRTDANTITIASTVIGGLTDIVNDTTPQLGGSLDVNGQTITSTSNGNIELAPNGTGDVLLTADTIRVGDSNADATITTNGTGDLILNTNSGTNSGTIKIEDGSAGKISIIPNTTGRVDLGHEAETTTNFPTAIGGSGAYEVTDARIRGTGRFYSNLTYAPYTATTDQVIAGNTYAMVKTNGGSFDSANIRNVASANQMVFDLNGGSATATTTNVTSTGVGPQVNTNYYMNTAGGTKTGLNVVTNRNFTQIVAGHGGALTIPRTVGVLVDINFGRNTGDTTTLTEAWAVRDQGITYSGTGVTATNSIVTDYTAFETGVNAPSSTNTPWAFRVRTPGQSWRSNIGASDLPKRWSTSTTHSASGAYTVDYQSTGNGFRQVTLGANITSFTMSNFPTSTNQICEFDIVFIQDGTGGRTISFTPTSTEVFKFRNGTSSLSDSTAAPEILHAKVFTRYDGTKTIFYWDIDNREYV